MVWGGRVSLVGRSLRFSSLRSAHRLVGTYHRDDGEGVVGEHGEDSLGGHLLNVVVQHHSLAGLDVRHGRGGGLLLGEREVGEGRLNLLDTHAIDSLLLLLGGGVLLAVLRDGGSVEDGTIRRRMSK